jgi:integrase
VGAVDTSGRPIYRENEGLRHAFGTHAVNRGVPLDRAGAYLGHSERRTTERYAKLAGEGLSDVLRPSGITAKKRRKVGENKNGSS